MKCLIIKFLCIVAIAGLMACGGGGSDAPAPLTGDSTASAGNDQDVNTGGIVDLDGSGSSDPDNQTLTYTWTQVSGSDVTGGTGTLTGATPSFTAPDMVGTVAFDLHVNDGENSAPDRVQVNVMEDRSTALFVDGDNGDDTAGDGSRTTPYATVAYALSQVSINQDDVYVMSLASASYDETGATLFVPAGTSLYGGYDSNWVRDVDNNRTTITGAATAVKIEPVSLDPASSTISGLAITATTSSDPTDDTRVISAEGPTILTVRDNTLIASNVATGKANPPGQSFGVHTGESDQVAIINNIITTGRGGDGANGTTGVNGTSGGDAFYNSGGVNPVVSNLNGYHGGGGGWSTSNLCKGYPGDGPDGGAAGGGDGGSGIDAIQPGNHGTAQSRGHGDITTGYLHPYSGGQGLFGQDGTPGSGGGGTGGIYTVPPVGSPYCLTISPLSLPGGGGGAAASAGQGGAGGAGGGASAGIFVTATNQLQITANTISAAGGGNAGNGGNGGQGALGGAGETVLPGLGGHGGNSTGGGDGAGGGGGVSAAIVLGPGIGSGSVTGNTLSNGNGGAGGDARHGTAGDGGWSYSIIDWNDTIGGIPYSGNVVQNQGVGGTEGTVTGTGLVGNPGQSGFHVLLD